MATREPILTYIVNLRRRQDRRERMEAILPTLLQPTFTTFWEGPFDGQDLSVSMLKGVRLFPWEIPSDNEWWGRPLKKGEIACTLAHLACWRDAVDAGAPHALFLEDDVVFADLFEQQLLSGLEELQLRWPEWDALYLGRVPIDPDTRVSERFVHPGYSHCTYAYMLTRGALIKMLQAKLDTAVIPVDEFLPAMYCDHPRPDVRRRFPKALIAFAFDPAIVLQLPKAIAGSDTEATEFVDESWSNALSSDTLTEPLTPTDKLGDS